MTRERFDDVTAGSRRAQMFPPSALHKVGGKKSHPFLFRTANEAILRKHGLWWRCHGASSASLSPQLLKCDFGHQAQSMHYKWLSVERLNWEENKAALARFAVQLVCLFIKGPYSFSPTEISSCGPHKTQKHKDYHTYKSKWVKMFPEMKK